MPPTRTNRVLQITTQVRDRMTPALKASRIAMRLLRTTAVGTFRAIGVAARVAGRAIKAMLGPIGLIITALGGFGLFKLIDTATTVEERVREIGTLIPGIGEEALDKLSRDIREAAVEGGQAFEDEFTAAYDAVSAGIAPQRLVSFLGTANRLAVAGATDVGQATDLLTGQLNAFGKEGQEAERVADAMFTAVRKGKTTIQELAEGMGQVASTAGAAKFSIEDTAASMAALTLVTGDTNIAATQLRAVISALASATDAQKTALGDTGPEFSIAAVQGLGFLEFIRQLNDAVDGDIVKLKEFVPNIRAVNGILNLAAKDTQNLADAYEAMGDNVGAANAAFELRAGTAGFAFRRLRTTIADVATEIGNAFLPNLADVADKLREFLTENKDAIAGFARDVSNAIELIGRSLPLVRTLIVDLLNTPAEENALADVIRVASELWLAVVRETATAGIKVVFALIRGSFRNFVNVAGTIAEQVGARILKGLVRPFFKLPELAAKALDAGFDLIPVKAREALAALRPELAPFIRGTILADGKDIEAEVDRLVERITDSTEDKIIAAEKTLAKIAQRTFVILKEEASAGGEAIEEAVDNIDAAFDKFLGEFQKLGKDSPAVAAFLEGIAAIRAAMDGAGDDAQAAGDAAAEAAAKAAKAVEQARRNADRLGASPSGVPDAAVVLSPEALARSAALLEEANRRMLRGVERTVAELELEYDKQVESYRQALDRQEISQEAFNAASEALERERGERIASARREAQATIDELVFSTNRRLLVGTAATIADVEAEYRKQADAFHAALASQAIDQETFNRLSVTLERARQQDLARVHEEAAAFEALILEEAALATAGRRERELIEARAHFDARKAELDRFLAEGLISLDTFTKAVQAAQAELTQSTINQTGTLVDGVAAGFAALEEQIETPFEAGFRLITELSAAANRAFDSAIDDAIRGTFDLERTLEELGKTALSIFAKIAAKQAALAATRFLFPGFGGFAEGGITSGPIMRSIPFDAFQEGGITRSPSLALIGEGRLREAVVPLPDGRTIPAIISEPPEPPAALEFGRQALRVIEAAVSGAIRTTGIIDQLATARMAERLEPRAPAIIVEATPAPTIINEGDTVFQLGRSDPRGLREVIAEEAETIRNIVADGVNRRRDFRSTVRGQ